MNAELQKKIEHAAIVLKEAGAREVYVFGSATTDKLDEYSDIDLAVTGLPPENFFKAMGKAGDILGRPMDLVDLDEGSLFTDYLKKKGKLHLVG